MALAAAAAAKSGAPGKPCYWHPGTPGVAFCQICRRPLCEGCKVVLPNSNQVYCKTHGLKGHRMQAKQPW